MKLEKVAEDLTVNGKCIPIRDLEGKYLTDEEGGGESGLFGLVMFPKITVITQNTGTICVLYPESIMITEYNGVVSVNVGYYTKPISDVGDGSTKVAILEAGVSGSETISSLSLNDKEYTINFPETSPWVMFTPYTETEEGKFYAEYTATCGSDTINFNIGL